MTHHHFNRDIHSLQQFFSQHPEDFESFPLNRPVTAITIGVGSRGNAYGNYALAYPKELTITGVVDPGAGRRETYARHHQVHPDHCYSSWEELFALPRMADVIIVSTPDQFHYEPAMQALAKGYHLLLEKPIAPTLQQCLDIQAQAKKYRRIVAVCHVLRYTPYFRKMKAVIDSGVLGRMIQVQHFEPIGYEHFMHSYVRGNWQNADATTPIILAKACHDMDVLRWLIGRKMISVSAYGSLNWFHQGNAPAASSDRCTTCRAESSCAYSAVKMYHRDRKRIKIFDLPDDEQLHGDHIMRHLETGPYGQCVFQCNNNQPDHFAAAMQFEDQITVNFSMSAFTSYEGRRTRLLFSHGDIEGNMQTMTINNFVTGKSTVWESPVAYNSATGHAGGDEGLVRDFVQAIAYQDESRLSSGIDVSIDSHIMGFKTEESRVTGQQIFLR